MKGVKETKKKKLKIYITRELENSDTYQFQSGKILWIIDVFLSLEQ